MEVLAGLQAHEPVKESSFLPTEGDDMWEAGFECDRPGLSSESAASVEPDIGQEVKGIYT